VGALSAIRGARRGDSADALRRRTLQSLGGLAVFAALGACRRSGSERRSASQTAPPDAPAPPRRIVSLSPNTTETLFALDAGDRVVGRSRFCDYPPEVAKIPSVGGYVDASLEAILALAPDLVVGARGPAGPALVEKLGSLGIATFFPATESMAQIDDMIEALGAKLGAAREAHHLVDGIHARGHGVRRALQGEPIVHVLVVFGLSPIVAAGPDSFVNEMIVLARGANVVMTGGAYPMLPAERLLALAPDIVVDAAAMTGANPPGQASIVRDDPRLARQPTFRELAAVRERRVVALYDEAVLRPGPRIGDGLATLARAIHPTATVP
jgi:iron complex transport system substrate-binding protein